jgi:hypothetical protein
MGRLTHHPTKENKEDKLGDKRVEKLRDKLGHNLGNKRAKPTEKTHHSTKGNKK